MTIASNKVTGADDIFKLGQSRSSSTFHSFLVRVYVTAVNLRSFYMNPQQSNTSRVLRCFTTTDVHRAACNDSDYTDNIYSWVTGIIIIFFFFLIFFFY